MDRRSFLKTLGGAVAGAAVVASGVEIVLPKAAPVVTRAASGIKGLPYLVEKSGSYFGMNIHTAHNLKAVELSAGCEPLTRCMMENVKRKSLERMNRPPSPPVYHVSPQYAGLFRTTL